MRFINKWYFIIWILIIVVSFFFASSFATLCVELTVDSEGRMLTGGCGPDWGIVGLFIIRTSIIYNIFYAAVYLILRKKKH